MKDQILYDIGDKVISKKNIGCYKDKYIGTVSMITVNRKGIRYRISGNSERNIRCGVKLLDTRDLWQDEIESYK